MRRAVGQGHVWGYAVFDQTDPIATFSPEPRLEPASAGVALSLRETEANALFDNTLHAQRQTLAFGLPGVGLRERPSQTGGVPQPLLRRPPVVPLPPPFRMGGESAKPLSDDSYWPAGTVRQADGSTSVRFDGFVTPFVVNPSDSNAIDNAAWAQRTADPDDYEDPQNWDNSAGGALYPMSVPELRPVEVDPNHNRTVVNLPQWFLATKADVFDAVNREDLRIALGESLVDLVRNKHDGNFHDGFKEFAGYFLITKDLVSANKLFFYELYLKTAGIRPESLAALDSMGVRWFAEAPQAFIVTPPTQASPWATSLEEATRAFLPPEASAMRLSASTEISVLLQPALPDERDGTFSLAVMDTGGAAPDTMVATHDNEANDNDESTERQWADLDEQATGQLADDLVNLRNPSLSAASRTRQQLPDVARYIAMTGQTDVRALKEQFTGLARMADDLDLDSSTLVQRIIEGLDIRTTAMRPAPAMPDEAPANLEALRFDALLRDNYPQSKSEVTAFRREIENIIDEQIAAGLAAIEDSKQAVEALLGYRATEAAASVVEETSDETAAALANIGRYRPVLANIRKQFGMPELDVVIENYGHIASRLARELEELQAMVDAAQDE